MLSTIIYVIAIIRRRLKKIGRGVSLIAAGYADGQKLCRTMQRKFAEE